jgi:hypothetical protein
VSNPDANNNAWYKNCWKKLMFKELFTILDDINEEFKN